MRLHWKFEWDQNKAAENLRRHGVSFDDAVMVLGQDDGDNRLFEVFDYEHSDDEDRYRTVGSDPENRSRVLLITWTERESDEGAITRIISARAATPRQQREYAERIQRRNRS